MAKTNFENGTVVTSTWLDAINSHTHDGADNDGHCSKINLSSGAEVSGTLPKTNLESLGSDDIVDDSDYNLTTATDAINNIKGSIDDFYEDVTDLNGTLKLTGFTADEDLSFYAQFHRHRSSSLTPSLDMVEIVLYLSASLHQSNSTTMTIKSDDIPADLRPSSSDTNQAIPISIEDNSTFQCGLIVVSNTGAWNIYKADGSVFTATGEKGLPRQVIRYVKSVS